MPFKSKAQARYLFAKHPDVAQEFLSKMPGQHPIKALPEHVSKRGGARGGQIRALPMKRKK